MKDNILLSTDQFENAKNYWLKKLEGDLSELALPSDFARTLDYERKTYPISISEKLAAELLHIAKNQDLTLYVVLLAVFKVLIFKITQQKDIIITSPVYSNNEEIFNKYVVFRDILQGEMSFKELLINISQTVSEGYKQQFYPLGKLMDALGVEDNLSLFKAVLVLENIHKTEYVDDIINSPKNDISININRKDIVMDGVISYNSKRFKQETVEKLFSCYLRILEQVLADINIKVKDLCLVSEEEKKRLQIDFNNTCIDYKDNLTIIELFEEQAERLPDQTAVTFYESKLTYSELNIKANQLARVLRQKGIGPEKIVGIMVDRSLEMLVGIFGILKAGGAYLPIDPAYPEERIGYMLGDSKVDIILTQKHLMDSLKFEGELIDIEAEKLYSGNSTNLEKVNNPNDLAYIIYTSGTTGNPKGVMVEHKSISNTLQWRRDEYKLSEKDSVLQLFSYSFDGFLTSFFTPIISGSEVILLNNEDAKDPVAIKNCIASHKVTHFISVPTLYGAVLDYAEAKDLKHLRLVTLAGEKVTCELVEKSKGKKADLELVNEYGPTEVSVVSTLYRDLQPNSVITIGKPVANTQIYILDKDNCMMPTGIYGEICISGRRLARGYLNRPEMTKEKFVPNHFVPGEIMYRTGDLGRWDEDGNVEFLGRTDHQVKIRGYRIELGEIEHQLMKNELIKEALVIDREDKNGNKYLCAYIAAEKILPVSELRKSLLQVLPDYMVPTYFVQLDKIPLTPNGKTDRKALPEPDENMDTGVVYTAPEGKVQEILVGLWQEVLGKERIGIDDNFFQLGGDSIKVVQVTSRLQRFKLKAETKYMFKYQTIRELSPYVKVDGREIDQSIVEGEVGFTPIQKWFFEQNFSHKNHWNQSIALFRKEGFDEDMVRRVFKAIVSHHDALRMVYREHAGEVTQVNRGLEGELFHIEVVDLLSTESNNQLIEAEANKLQASIDLENGPLVKMDLFKTQEGDHLLIVIHHLVVDGVSWRILLEDFNIGYEQAAGGKAIKFQDKTDSFRDWSKKLKEYAESEKLLEEAEYWNKLGCVDIKLIPKDAELQSNMVADSNTVSIELDEEETGKLLEYANKAYGINVDEVLLTALTLAVKDFTGDGKALVNLEGHGREDIFEDMDISRTVGWFTSAFPVLLDLKEAGDMTSQLKIVKESVRSIPNKGIGYGILRYLSSMNNKNVLQQELKPEISFNYLGQFDQDTQTGQFEMSQIPMGYSISQESQRLYALDVVGLIAGGKLTMALNYNKGEYKENTAVEFINNYKGHLQAIIKHCFETCNIPDIKTLDNIEPFNDVFYKDCLYNAFFPVVRHFGKSIEPFLANDIVVYDYNNENGNVLIAADYSEMRDEGRILEELGISTEVKARSEDVVNDIIMAIAGGRPVIINVDCFYEPVRREYKQKHWSHALLVYGYDKEKQQFNVIEHEELNSLIFKKLTISFLDIRNAYSGYLENFFRGNNFATFYAFYPQGKSSNISCKPENLGEIVSTYANHIKQNREEILRGLEKLGRFNEDFYLLMTDKPRFEENFMDVLFSINNVIKAKTLEKYKVLKLFGNWEQEISRIETVVKYWSLIKANLQRCEYMSLDDELKMYIYKKLKDIYSIEVDYNNAMFEKLKALS